MPKRIQKAILEKIVARANEYLKTYELEAAVGKAVRDYIGDEGSPSFRQYFAAAIERIHREAERARKEYLHSLKTDAVRVALTERRDDLLGEEDRDPGLDDYLSRYEHNAPTRH